ncbi:2-phospho-L-lactate transferase CofD family protein [Mobilicoccus pelagius]|uniref:LPPG--FO 2-phopspho-L-lactate transferase n=1 Tax=Mobilicoccus pelagius NBRC 104925 TaxID=1089455 RepID=H5URV0_9MICO|nr:2-phospho-L-lactate transferase CofD family protein [Mobilicoccus pelagius]GAB48458.1 LPPG--FO 2-phopspho-L-lactate transferase [Mobilicoccus pelagius NBRC 104925]
MHAVLACGPGGRALAADLAHLLAIDTDTPHGGDATPEAAEIALTIVAGGAEDITLCGLRFCPDLDALARIPALDDDTPGHDGHTLTTALTGWGALPSWFTPDDRDVARAVARSRWLAGGATPGEIATRLTPPRHGVQLLPMSDRPVEAHVVLEQGDDRYALHALEWASTAAGITDGAPTPVHVSAAGLTDATPAPGVLDAVRQATSIALPLTSPVTGLGVMLGLPGLRDALRGTSARVVGLGPHLLPARGDEEATLRSLDLPFTSRDVGALFEDVLDVYLVPETELEETRRRLREVDVRPAPADPTELARAVLAASEHPTR